jgi:hypothetical protein
MLDCFIPWVARSLLYFLHVGFILITKINPYALMHVALTYLKFETVFRELFHLSHH